MCNEISLNELTVQRCNPLEAESLLYIQMYLLLLCLSDKALAELSPLLDFLQDAREEHGNALNTERGIGYFSASE